MTDHLPKAVREQAERAEAWMARGTPGDEPPAAEAQEQALDESKPEVESKPDEQADVPAKVEPSEPQPLGFDGALERDYASAKERDHADDADYWKRRFASLQGRYNKEAREAKEALPELRATIDRLTAELAHAKAQHVPAQGDAPDEKLKQIRDRLADEFGEEVGSAFVDLVEARLDARIAPLEQRAAAPDLDRVERESKTFWTQLEQIRPDWEAINTRPDWLAWCQSFDPATGVKRQEQLDALANARDAQGVAALFAHFMEGIGKEPGATPAGESHADPSNKVMPDSRGSSAAPQGKRIWTRADVTAFFSPNRREVYTPEQEEALKSDIFAAMREGRVR